MNKQMHLSLVQHLLFYPKVIVKYKRHDKSTVVVNEQVWERKLLSELDNKQ